ncbi:hypothetical protein FOCG_14208 [Fusarium oxysporum f. sp. radicis-lycopersici 26381]|uniref:Uncharacterized protein n=1 Tax=Fusarium oxysporum Fo47 TaxID=660027 RepID=W9L575_FUSOX|nr:hypothetical protein FOZG_01819 [Fusarium oxysporum Fo47]EXL43966.1 hypothetical protein FOCG_14208 [Fusarium oxysporum f. sp. radicis-lycopersici 26381]
MSFHIHNVYGYHGEGEVAGERRRGDLIHSNNQVQVQVQVQGGRGQGSEHSVVLLSMARTIMCPPDQSLTLRTLWGTITGFNDEKPKHEEGNWSWSWSWSCTSASACYDVSNKRTNKQYL